MEDLFEFDIPEMMDKQKHEKLKRRQKYLEKMA
jgi:hypothetical protein